MFPTYDVVKKLCEERRMSLNDLERELGIGKNSLYGLKRSQPSAERLNQFADYFNVSVDFLLGRTEEKSDRELIRGLIQESDLDPKEMEYEKFFSMDIKKDGQKITDRDKRILKSMFDAYFKESTI